MNHIGGGGGVILSSSTHVNYDRTMSAYIAFKANIISVFFLCLSNPTTNRFINLTTYWVADFRQKRQKNTLKRHALSPKNRVDDSFYSVFLFIKLLFPFYNKTILFLGGKVCFFNTKKKQLVSLAVAPLIQDKHSY